MQFDALRRTTTFRLTALYGLLFAFGTLAMLGMVYVRSAGYLTNRVDTILTTEADALMRLPRPGLRERLADELAVNGTRISIYALFAADRSPIAGNLAVLPSGLYPGGIPQEIPPSAEFPVSARLIARQLPGGEILVVGRDVSQLREMREIISSALFWSGRHDPDRRAGIGQHTEPGATAASEASPGRGLRHRGWRSEAPPARHLTAR